MYRYINKKSSEIYRILKNNNISLYLIIAVSLNGVVFASDNIVDSPGNYKAYSRTSLSITGDIDFSEENKKLSVSFGGKEPVHLLSRGESSGKWSFLDPEKVIDAHIYEIDHDPGQLLNGNSLCGNTAAHYLVFYNDILHGTRLLELAVFSSVESPSNIDSKGLCGTFNYQNDYKALQQSKMTTPRKDLVDKNSRSIKDIYNIEKYCGDVGASVGGSYEIEQTCREQEKKSQVNLLHMFIPERVARYCQSVGKYAGGSYQIMETCIENELKAKNELEE